MKFSDYLYWFSRNLLAFILVLIFSPIYWIWQIIGATVGAIIILFNPSGSETIGFPHEWDWKFFN